MSDDGGLIPRGKMAGAERERRSRLTRLASGAGLVHGTLAVRERTCGKANCKCARGEKHVSLYVVASRDGKVRQLFVPKEWEQRVRQWVSQYQQARRLLDEISELYWDKVQDRRE